DQKRSVLKTDFIEFVFNLNDIDKARIDQKYRYEKKAEFANYIRPKHRERKRLPRSSYAFSQQEGCGSLVTSGILKIRPIENPITTEDCSTLNRAL
ncbi:unnamed protein product, partial [Rotaria sp. Silwood2]